MGGGIATSKNVAKTVVKFVHINILTHFGASRVIISDKGTHFFNRVFSSLMAKYGNDIKKGLVCHPQSNGQAEISNQEIKSILE